VAHACDVARRGYPTQSPGRFSTLPAVPAPLHHRDRPHHGFAMPQDDNDRAPPAPRPDGLLRTLWKAHLLASYVAALIMGVTLVVTRLGGPDRPDAGQWLGAALGFLAAPLTWPIGVYQVVSGWPGGTSRPHAMFFVAVAAYAGMFAWGFWLARWVAARVAAHPTGLCRQCGRDARSNTLRCVHCRTDDPLRIG